MLVWGCVVALGAEPQLPIEEVVVEAQIGLAEARRAIHDAMRRDGYRRVLSLGPRSWYVHPSLWKSNVMVHDEGFVRVRGVPVLPVGARPSPFRSDIIEGVVAVQSRRKREMQKLAIVQTLEPHLRALRDARWAIASAEREQAIVQWLVEVWFETSNKSRRAARHAIFERWLSTASGPSGEPARNRIVSFIDEQVQPSPHPFRHRELAWLNRSVPDDRDPLAIAPPSRGE